MRRSLFVKLILGLMIVLPLVATSNVTTAQEVSLPSGCVKEPTILWRVGCYDDMLYYRAVCETGLPIPDHIKSFDMAVGECDNTDAPTISPINVNGSLRIFRAFVPIAHNNIFVIICPPGDVDPCPPIP